MAGTSALATVARGGHVLWIGGPPGTGKTSIARRLAAENDLRVYHADAHTWVHHDRALARGFPATVRWERMTAEERWVETAPEHMAEHSLEMNADRFRLMLEDVSSFPASALIVVEGTPLLPWLVADVLASPSHGVWLLPAPELERAILAGRPTTSFDETSDPARAAEHRTRRELLVAEAIARGAHEHGLATLRVDESTDLAAVHDAVATRFGPLLERGPRAATATERRALRRDENGRYARQILTYLERVPAAGRPEEAEYAFACECGRSGCSERVSVSVSECARTSRTLLEPLTHPSHRAEIL